MSTREPRVKEVTSAKITELRETLDRLTGQAQTVEKLMTEHEIASLLIDGGAKAFDGLLRITTFLHDVHSACDVKRLPKFGEGEPTGVVTAKPKHRQHKK